MEYETEEQQLEAIKNWWKENSTNIIGGIVVGVMSIYGWQYYQSESISHAQDASVLYEKVLNNSTIEAKANEQLIHVNKLEAEYADTPYASLSALILAKQQLEAGEVIKAQQQYQWVIENASQVEIQYLAKLRLARLYLNANQSDQALALLSESYPQSYNTMVLELKGDVLLSQGKAKLARVAYKQAIVMSDGSSRWLQLKIDDLGDEPAVANTSTENSEPST